ncbi:excisionase family DNA-binding protein [Bradyrhizobium sp. 44]|uniref:excisionase family DNA-binding protein n=1 Tax=Bradyrhizobium sp. 44 TaxID=2782675 RepID=UPI001FFB0072|nr:excisionase family DNA-binding protein [Bradyrhizobium sp. 44]MCK1284097.1 excisionase family DNA-binding protein [Bradyrhizobium sp. 44]
MSAKVFTTATKSEQVSETLLTLNEAAERLGLPYWQLQRAVRRGTVPSYAPFNRRRLVYLSELKAFVAASRQGGSL